MSPRPRSPFGDVGPPKSSDRGPTRRGRSASASEQGSFEGILDAEQREARARAVAAEDRARAVRAKGAKVTRTGDESKVRGRRHSPDARPLSSGPRQSTRTPTASPTMRRLSRQIRRLGTRRPRQVLIVEMLAVMSITAISDASNRRAPTMSSFVAPFAVFLILAFTAEFGDQAARLASGLGALVLIATVIAHGDGLVNALEVVTGRPQRTTTEGD